jgi:acetyl esterase/lipase
MRARKFIRIFLPCLAGMIVLAGTLAGSTWLYLHPQIERINGVEYGERNGRKLVFDLLKPAKTNGLGIILMVSGGWKSSNPGTAQSWIVAPLLRRGYTVFAVYHISQPQATVMEIVADVNRAVRFVRHNARDYRVDAKRLGVTGGSAGGHLSLMLATRGGPGPADAVDLIDRESSEVQAVGIFFPVTDLLNLGSSTENAHDGGPPRSFVKAFGPSSTNLTVWKVIGREMSPLYYVHSNLPPTLIVHGDADALVPLEQSQRFQEAARKLGCQVDIVVHHGGGHGWWSMIWDVRRIARWFDQSLRVQSRAS